MELGNGENGHHTPRVVSARVLLPELEWSGCGLSGEPQKMTSAELEGMKCCLLEHGVIEVENISDQGQRAT